MSKRRGLSLEEKRTRLLEIFFEKKAFFQLKELEKLGHKEKGINSMSVKEILQSLVDDDLVDTDRVGTSNYFWSFPSKAANKRRRKIDDLEKAFSESEAKKAHLTKKIAEAEVGREDTKERADLLTELGEKRQVLKQLCTELDKHKACDPERMKQLSTETAVAKEATNRWTENVFAVKSWCKNKFGVEEATLDKQFEIPDDFDYL